MPSVSEKQRRFFYAVKQCKETGKCKPNIKEVAKKLTTKQIEDFLKVQKYQKNNVQIVYKYGKI